MYYPVRKWKGGIQDNVSQELLQNLKQQNLMALPIIPEMQRLQNNMDNILYRAGLGDYDKVRQYMQLQNRFLTYKHQLNSIHEAATMLTQPQEQEQISTNVLAGNCNLPTVPIPVQEPTVILPMTPVQVPTVEPEAKVVAPQALSTMVTSTPTPSALPSSLLTPPPTVDLSPPKKRKRPQIRLTNYLDEEEPKGPSRRSRHLHRNSPYKYSKIQEDDY